MFHHVYANGRSVCCKAGDGASKAALPDVCWTPPQPATSPMPYPNTAFAADLANGSRTVFIQGSEVAKKDLSYFATSTGDEPATDSCARGFVTGAIQGKAYFFSWSMNVTVEHENVCRHLDVMGHNHASIPSNTPLFPFLERSRIFDHACEDEQKRIDKACAKEEEEQDPRWKKPKKKRLFNLQNKKPKRGAEKENPNDWHWNDDHCDGLQFVPTLGAAQDMLAEAEAAIQELDVQQALIDKVKQELGDYLQEAALKGGGKLLAKAAAKQAAGSFLPVIGNIAMGLWTAYDVYSTYQDLDQLKALYDETVEYVGTLKSKLPELQGFLDRYKREGASEALMADVMDSLATINACTRHRKCNLVPYRSKGGGSAVEPADKGGCCPGQTGHHLIPDALTKDGACPGYKKREAPTVCVEGRGHDHGSHGRIHTAFDGAVRKLADHSTKTISMDKAIDAAVASHAVSFPLSRCDPRCIKAQLVAYYKEKCPNAQLPALDKDGKVVKDDATPDADD